jgi:hypothetical protein
MIERKYIFSFIFLMLLLVPLLVIKPLDKPAEKIVIKGETITHVNKDVIRIDNFIGLVVMSADIQSNSRRVLYYFMSDPEINGYFDIYFHRKAISDNEPLFLKKSDGVEINARTIRLINHEVVCTPYSATLASKFIPEISDKVASVCSFAVPPSYGQFTGMVSIYLSKTPTMKQRELIKVIISDIADDLTFELKKP